MFPSETLPPAYLEERAAAEAAQKLAEQQRSAALEAQAQAPTAAQQISRSQHALYQPSPPLSRPGSSTVLGGIFQGFMKRTPSTPGFAPSASTTPPPGLSAAPSRTQTPVEKDGMQRKEAEAVLLAQVKRDADICAWPGWH